MSLGPNELNKGNGRKEARGHFFTYSVEISQNITINSVLDDLCQIASLLFNPLGPRDACDRPQCQVSIIYALVYVKKRSNMKFYCDPQEEPFIL